MQKVSLQMSQGTATAYTFQPAEQGKFPAVIFYMDAFGPRPALFEMAQRIADAGFWVLLPDLYYRLGDYESFDQKTAFSDPAQREKIMSMIHSVTNTQIVVDARDFLDFLQQTPIADATRVGTVGYCMGGPLSLTTAAAFPKEITASASIHGGRLVTDQPDSPHLQGDKITAQLYIGAAAEDRSFTPDQRDLLHTTFTKAGVNFEMEVYPETQHGFAVLDSLVYNRTASERHFQKLTEFFTATLKS